MPNWCYCTLEIRCDDPKKLNKFIRFAKYKDNVLLTTRFIPYPPEREAMDNKISVWEANHDETQRCPYSDWFNQGGYEWCCKNWGTKWGICRPSIKNQNDNNIIYFFETAWSPPLPIILRMSEMIPELTFKLEYSEEGMGFEGTFVCENGEVEIDESRECETNDEDDE